MRRCPPIRLYFSQYSDVTLDSARGGEQPHDVSGKAAAPVYAEQPNGPVQNGSELPVTSVSDSSTLPANAASSPCAVPVVPMCVRVSSSSAVAFVIPAALVRALIEEKKSLAQILKGQAGGRFDNKVLTIMGVGREQSSSSTAAAPLALPVS